MPRLQYEYFCQMQFTRSIVFGDRLKLVKTTLEDRNFLPRLEMQVIVNGEKHHEVQEERSGRQEMPDVMVVIKVEQLTLEEERRGISNDYNEVMFEWYRGITVKKAYKPLY